MTCASRQRIGLGPRPNKKKIKVIKVMDLCDDENKINMVIDD